MSNLFQEIQEATSSIRHGRGWTTLDKAQTLASAVFAVRPQISLEIGVYTGIGVISFALAHKAIGIGRVIGIDPYNAGASAEGQANDADRQFWEKLDHDMIYQECLSHIEQFKVQNLITLIRKRSDEVEPPQGIGVLRIDGNHGDAVIGDIERYCPNVVVGGLLFLDDLGWTGGSVRMAADELLKTGWVELYKIDDGAVFQKVSA